MWFLLNNISIIPVLIVGIVLRVCLIVYGDWQDRTQLVKYTDVDYYVFTDAAQFITKGESPYLRPTYRYTPLLAWVLTPSVTFTPVFGKLVFVIFDILTGYLIYKLCKAQGVKDRNAVLCSCLWLLNPMPATVSSRGNAESIMAALVLLSLIFLLEKRLVLAALVYGLSVHVKIYPAVYALQIYLYLNPNRNRTDNQKSLSNIFKNVMPNRERILFVGISALVFSLLTGIFYYWYGWDFLHETYLYHLTRRDIRHNFSIYFYMLYLTALSDYTSVIGLLSFIPQMIILLLFSMKFRKEAALCWFLNTFVFVTFNKVCTSQYFLWYLSILPVIIPKLQMSASKAILLISGWVFSQAVWLLFAYYLEFEGQSTFMYIWMAGVLFFVTNIWIMSVIIEGYVPKLEKNAKKEK